MQLINDFRSSVGIRLKSIEYDGRRSNEIIKKLLKRKRKLAQVVVFTSDKMDISFKGIFGSNYKRNW